MSTPTRTGTGGIVTGVTVMFCVVVVSVTCLAILAPKGTDVTAIATALIGTLATAAGIVATLVKVSSVADQQAAGAEQLTYLANGGMDAKIRAGIADIVRAELLKPGVDEQLAADREHRAAGPGSPTSSSDSSPQPVIGQDDVALSGIDPSVPQHRRD